MVNINNKINKMAQNRFKILVVITCCLAYSALTLSLSHHNLRAVSHLLSFKDNLQVQNWYYGNISAVDYRLRIFQAATQDQVSSCPIDKPFASANMSQCQSCPPEAPLRNLATQTCGPCPGNQTYDSGVGNCTSPVIVYLPISNASSASTGSNSSAQGINATVVTPNSIVPIAPVANATNATSGSNSSTTGSSSSTVNSSASTTTTTTSTTTTTNSTTGVNNASSMTSNSSSSSTQAASSVNASSSSNAGSTNVTGANSTTSSSNNNQTVVTVVPILNNTQVTNPQSNGTSSSNTTSTTSTTTVTTTTTTNSTTNTAGTTPGAATSSNTSIITTVPVIGTNSSQGAVSYNCSSSTPLYDSVAKTCVACPSGTQYMNITNVCLPIIYVANLAKATNLIQPSANFTLQQINSIKSQHPTRNVQVCPDSQPYLSFLNGSGVCVGCPANQYFVVISQTCIAGCPVGTIYSTNLQICQPGQYLTDPAASNLLSPTGQFQQWKQGIQNSYNQTANSQYCASQTPYEVNGKCIACNSTSPLFNIESSTCMYCGPGRQYSQSTKKCESQYSGGLSLERMIANIL